MRTQCLLILVIAAFSAGLLGERCFSNGTKIEVIDKTLAHISYKLAMYDLQHGDYQSALGLFERAIKLQPTFCEAYCNRGYIKYSFKQNLAAIQDFTTAINLDPRIAWTYCSRGDCKDDIGDLDGAIQDYTQALAVDPGYVRAYMDRANSFTKRGDLQLAIEDWNQTLSLAPKCFYGHYQIGLLSLKLGNKEGARTAFKSALRINPNFKQAKREVL